MRRKRERDGDSERQQGIEEGRQSEQGRKGPGKIKGVRCGPCPTVNLLNQ